MNGSTLEPSSSTAKLESWLGEDERLVLWGAAVRLGVDHREWPQVPCVRQLFETLAVARRRDELLALGLSRRGALVQACEESGLSFEALKARLTTTETSIRKR